MIVRIPQRTKEDCAICVVAMVMGHPYSYERVQKDSMKYAKVLPDGNFNPWWESYLRDKGFEPVCRPFRDLYCLPHFGGSVVGLLGMNIPHIKWGHIVAVDELGVIDAADGAPEHMEVAEYIFSRKAQGFVFHSEFLLVKREKGNGANPQIYN